MRLFLRLIVLISIVCGVACVLSSGIGQHFPNTVIAYTESCQDSAGIYPSKTYVADWRPEIGLRFALPGASVTYYPAWSLDGKQLAYGVNETGRYEIYLREIKNGAVHKLIADTRMLNNPPSWSPDDHTIAYFLVNEVRIYDTLTDVLQGYPFVTYTNAYSANWSPDGRLLAVFGAYPDQRSEVYIINIVSGAVQNLSQGQFDQVENLAWSPDGRYLTFNGTKGAVSGIYESDLQTNTFSLFVRNDEDTLNIAVAWSPDGQTIAITTTTWAATPAEVHLFNPRGDLIRKIILSERIPDVNGAGSQIAWSPDGQYLLLYVPVKSQWRNYAYQLATDEAFPLSFENGCFYTRADWRPALAP